jgi:hypothetical protein
VTGGEYASEDLARTVRYIRSTLLRQYDWDSFRRPGALSVRALTAEELLASPPGDGQ